MKLKLLKMLELINLIPVIGFLVFCLTVTEHPDLYFLDYNGYKYYAIVMAILFLPSLLIVPIHMYLISKRDKSKIGRDWFWYNLNAVNKNSEFTFQFYPRNMFIHGFEDVLFVFPLLLFDLTSYYYVIPMGIVFGLAHVYKNKTGMLFTALLYIFVIFPTCKEYGLITGILLHAIYDMFLIWQSQLVIITWRKKYPKELRKLERFNRIQPIRFDPKDWLQYLPKKTNPPL